MTTAVGAEMQEAKAYTAHWLTQFPPEAPVVVITIFNAFDDVLECVDSVLRNTTPRTPVLLVDDASTDSRMQTILEPLVLSHGFAYVRKPTNRGLVDTSNLVFDWCKPRDIVILNSDTIVPPEWLERLRAAAYCQSSIATATPLTNNATIYSVPHRNTPTYYLPGGMTAEIADSRIRTSSLALRPIVPCAVAFCTYFRRSALDLVGYFDEVFSPGYGEEVDFSLRAVTAGIHHVLADDLFVFHKGSRSFGRNTKKQYIQDSHEDIINQRYPWYRPYIQSVEKDTDGPLAQALERARMAILGSRIAIDATCIGEGIAGTQMATLGLIRSLAKANQARQEHLTIIIKDRLPRAELLGVDQLVDDVITQAELSARPAHSFDLIHRPFQLRSSGEFERLRLAASRVVISQLDCIAFANPAYFPSWDDWETYRTLTQEAFKLADGMLFISKYVSMEAVHHGLHIPRERQAVTYLGVDSPEESPKAKRPADSRRFEKNPFLLVVGTNFKHKNRIYALRLLATLIEQHGWPGNIVFAGPDVAWGGSGSEEALTRVQNPLLHNRVFYLGPVSEEEKLWLMQKAALVLYPSISEGFGFVPFEAAAAGTASVSSRATCLQEVLGDLPIYLESFNPVEGAGVVWSLLTDPDLRKRQRAAISERATAFTWDKVAQHAWTFYADVLARPPRVTIPRTPAQAAATIHVPSAPPAPAPPPQIFRLRKGIGGRWRNRIERGVVLLKAEGPGELLAVTRLYFRSRIDYVKRVRKER